MVVLSLVRFASAVGMAVACGILISVFAYVTRQRHPIIAGLVCTFLIIVVFILYGESGL